MKIKLFFVTAFLLACTYLLGLFASVQMAETAPVVVAPREANTSLILFLGLFFAATAFLLLLFQITKNSGVYRVLFMLLLCLGLIQLFELVFPFGFSVLLTLIFLVGFFLVPVVWTHTIIVMLSSAGIASVFSLQFSFATASLLLIILSVYDIVAVVVTKHMTALAHEMIRRQATFAFFVPETLKNFGAHISRVAPGSGFLIIGGGDIIVPLIALSTVARTNMAAAMVGIVGTLIGVFVNHLLLVSFHKPVPALPFLTVGMFVGVWAGYGVT
jgi:presenilin-like A22 family membrane protease